MTTLQQEKSVHYLRKEYDRRGAEIADLRQQLRAEIMRADAAQDRAFAAYEELIILEDVFAQRPTDHE